MAKSNSTTGGIEKFKDAYFKAAKPKDKIYRLGDGGGLTLLVYPTGAKYWSFRYRDNGKDQNVSLGIYPDTTLKMARDKAAQARTDLASNPRITPKQRAEMEAKAKAEEERLKDNTFEAMARAWFEKEKKHWKNEKHRAQVIGTLETWAFPVIGKIPVAELRPYDVRQVIEALTDKGLWETGQRVFQRVSAVMDDAIEQMPDDILYNPCDPLRKKLFKKRPRNYRKNFAALEPDELPELIKALDKASLLPTTDLAIRLSLLTAVRPGELRQAEWSEFDLYEKQWIIPESKMKMGLEHVVPLSDQSIDVLYRLEALTGRNKFLFPHRSKGKQCMSEGTVLMALKRLGFGDRTTAHGFRALFSTWANETARHRREVVDRQLAHVSQETDVIKGTTERRYNRAKYLTERITLMDEWANFITECGADNVVRLKKSS